MWDDLMSEAEGDLIEMMRDPGMDFTLTITREGNRWHVRIDEALTGQIKNGYGISFDEAWKDIIIREDDNPGTLLDPWTLHPKKLVQQPS
jgi:hypothetical protein